MSCLGNGVGETFGMFAHHQAYFFIIRGQVVDFVGIAVSPDTFFANFNTQIVAEVEFSFVCFVEERRSITQSPAWTILLCTINRYRASGRYRRYIRIDNGFSYFYLINVSSI